MYSPSKKLDIPNDFNFPYEPYKIQQQLMESVYKTLESKGIGIFESPTGTGKSLTLTCAALRWLLDHEALVRQDLENSIDCVSKEIKKMEEDEATASDWMVAQHQTIQKRNELSDLRRLSNVLETFELKLQEIKERQSKGCETNKKPAINEYPPVTQAKPCYDQDFIDDETVLDDLTAERCASLDEENSEDPSVPCYKDVKIYFCSRTHSQLAQVVREVKRTAYGKRIRCVSLASRQQLCVNPDVRRLPNVALINERCLDLARSGSTNAQRAAFDENGCIQKKSRAETLGSMKCVFKSTQAVRELNEKALCEILDVEDLINAGERHKACPYYAARAATPYAQLIMLPYQMLLHRKTRLQSGIDLNNSIVIIDEAHNLLDTIAQIHSVEVTLDHLLAVQKQITAYKMQYASRFSTANLLKINQLNFITKRLIKLLTPAPNSPETSSRMLRTHELMSEGEFFNINIFEILEFCERTRFAQKLQGFSQRMRSNEENQPASQSERVLEQEPATRRLLQKLQDDHLKRQAKCTKLKASKPVEKQSVEKKQENGQHQAEKATAPNGSVFAIRPLLGFLETLTESAEDGRILITIDQTAKDLKNNGLKYMLLNPGEHFKEIVQECRSIIVAGGTMRPTADLTEQLFKSCAGRVVEEFYDHVVPADAVLPFVVTQGPTGKQFCFSYAQRSSPEMLSEFGMTLQNICCVVPAGVICFLPSYDFLDVVYSHLQRSGCLDTISRRKSVFREPRASGQNVEKFLEEYAATIKSGRQGALLFSVVGGKLSEGLNFADDLGRCVIVVGMPYPNRSSPELIERMKYLDETFGTGAGSEYYENLCIKAVNQCIGRSVRHIRDYATVVLLDERYCNERIQNKLPLWISRSLQKTKKFGEMHRAMAAFFKLRK